MRARDERTALLTLVLTPGLGPRRIRRLRSAFGSASAALEAGAGAWRRTLADGDVGPVVGADRAHAEGARLERLRARVVVDGDAEFPTHWGAFDDLPPWLFVRGVWPTALAPWPPGAVAIVGSRRADAEATAFAHDLARELARAGVTVVSGLAYGVDAAAHRGALAAGPGGAPTVAVVAGGVDRPGPSGNLDLARRIVEAGGALVSEAPTGSRVTTGAFPRRNRLIAALSRAVVVVAAGAASGAHLTAGHAARYGRDVHVVPARPWDVGYEGNLALLRDGAAPLCGLDDALAQLAGADAASARVRASGPAELAWLVATLDGTPRTIDDLVGRTGRGVAATVAGLERLVAVGACRVDAERRYRSA